MVDNAAKLTPFGMSILLTPLLISSISKAKTTTREIILTKKFISNKIQPEIVSNEEVVTTPEILSNEEENHSSTVSVTTTVTASIRCFITVTVNRNVRGKRERER